MAHSTSHSSFFTYNLARPYPFRWFTPVVVTVFIVATVLFSLLNLAANGYVLVNQVSMDPNNTVTDGVWFGNWPSFFVGNNRPKCQSAKISNGDMFFTNNTALTYTATGMTQSDTGNVLDSLQYNNNILENCSISTIDVSLQGVTMRSSTQYAFTQWGSETTAYIACNVAGLQGNVILNMSTTYDYVLDSTPLSRSKTFLGTGFIQRNKTASPDLWWGESLMSLHWNSISGTMHDIQNANNQSGAIILQGVISFTQTLLTDDIRDYDFFGVDFRFTVDMPDRTIATIYPAKNSTGGSIADLHADERRPDVWIQADNFVKSMYSTILTDLGQKDVHPNILTDQDLLKYFLSDAAIIQTMPSTRNPVPGPATWDNYINATSTDILTPNITPSVITASYLCQLPRLKSTGNLLVSVIIADLVFLNAVWLIFKFIVDHFFLKDQDHKFSRVSQPSLEHANLEAATLLGGGGTGASHRSLSSHPARKAVSASGSTITTTEPDLFETDSGYVLTKLGGLDTKSEWEKSSRRPFHRQTSSSYTGLTNADVDQREFL